MLAETEEFIAGARSPFDGAASEPERTMEGVSWTAAERLPGSRLCCETGVVERFAVFFALIEALGPWVSIARLIPVPFSGLEGLRTDFGSAALSINPAAHALRTVMLTAK